MAAPRRVNRDSSSPASITENFISTSYFMASLLGLLDRRGVIHAIWVGYEPGVETEMERCADELLGEAEK